MTFFQRCPGETCLNDFIVKETELVTWYKWFVPFLYLLFTRNGVELEEVLNLWRREKHLLLPRSAKLLISITNKYR